MAFNRLNRRIHYWATAFLTLPILLVIGSGLLLQVKKEWSWVQPEEQRGTATSPQIGFEAILSSLRALGDLAPAGWEDIDRLDVRPARGIAKVLLRNGWEVQIDLGTGEVLQTAVRRSDWIESIHDGSFFAGDLSRLGIFLPAGIVLLVMVVSGVWMFLLPLSSRRKRKYARRHHAQHRVSTLHRPPASTTEH
jgi:uncharacterized iron-regulated membrane protein